MGPSNRITGHAEMSIIATAVPCAASVLLGPSISKGERRWR